MNPIQIPEHIKKLVPYKAGKPIDELAREKGLTRIVKLASNENPLGPSPAALQALTTHFENLHRYTDPSAYDLISAISEKYQVPRVNIVTASGSDALIQYLLSTFVGRDDEVLSSHGTFIGWYVNVNKYGYKSLLAPMKDYGYDLDAMASMITSKTKIIYIANPNNPTGTMIPRQALEKFFEKVPPHILICLDEAYTVFAQEFEDYPNGLTYKMDNLIVLRTMSKDYGLAGLRIGIGFGPEALIRELYKVKLPFEPNALAQAAAIAALQDDDFITRTQKVNRESLIRMREGLTKIGIPFTNSAANFLLLLFKDEPEASRFNEECMNRGLILRHVITFGIPNGIRMNSGTPEETEFALQVIKEVWDLLHS